MPNSYSGSPPALHPEQQALIAQSNDVTQVLPPPNLSLNVIGFLFLLYLVSTLSLGIYHAYGMALRQRRIQALEKLFKLNAPRRAVCSDGQRNSVKVPRRVYEPVPLPISKPITDMLSALDIPLGQGGFARDYIVSLTASDQVVIELKSERFDTFVSLLAADGTTVGENDDGPDGTTNSWLVVRVPTSGTYTVRVQASGETKAVGPFTLFVRRFRPQSGIQQF